MTVTMPTQPDSPVGHRTPVSPRSDHGTVPESNYGAYLNFPPGLEVRDFQVKGIEFMRKRKRAMNRDKMGLGKTTQGAYASVGPTLIVCPNYLTEQWYDWLNGVKKGANKHEPFAPEGRQRIVWCHGTTWAKLDALALDADFWVINMESLQLLGDELEEYAAAGKWQTVIFDECHHLRNKDAERSKTAVEISRYCEYVYELSGSPIWKEVDDLFMQFRILQPDVFTSYYHFVDQFCIADETRYGTRVLGVKKEQIKELDKLLDILSIGRDYKEAGRQLPPVITKYITIEFPKDVKDAYDDMCETFRMQLRGEEIKFDNFSQILRTMRLMTAFPGKHETAKNIIEDLHDPDAKVLVFSWYRETCQESARVLGGVAIDGSITDPAERRKLALSNKIVCATIASLGEGIDLSDVRTVIFLEEHYTPGSIEQALARVVRERQHADNTEPVLLYYVHVKDTIDEAIHARTEKRGSTIKEILREALGI